MPGPNNRFTVWPLPYDYKDAEQIESYARKLIGKRLRSFVTDANVASGRGKGRFGSLLEQFYFFKVPDSNPGPDFPEAGVELKSTPLKLARTGLVPKERLALGMIDYNKVHLEDWRKSGLLAKNSVLLLVWYLDDKS